MLLCEDLLKLNRIPNESEISLKLYANFFENYICKRNYLISLENNKQLLLNIAPTNFPHLIGLHKFKLNQNQDRNRLLKNQDNLEKFKGFLNLKNGFITIDDLKTVKNAAGNFIYEEMKTRILSNPLIYNILRNSEFLCFDKDKVLGKTSIKADYIFVNDIDNNKLQLFLKDNQGMNYPVSFISKSLLQDERNLNYYIENQDILKISKIEVLDYKAKNILEVITHGQAIHSKAEQEAASAKDINVSSNTIRDKIINHYSNELTAIKFISERSANIINNLNEIHGRSLVIKEIKDIHNEIGKRLETGHNKDDLEAFKNLSEVTDNIKQAKLSLKQEQAHEKALQNQLSKAKAMEMIQ